jgi:CAAX prenyl protease-like protein
MNQALPRIVPFGLFIAFIAAAAPLAALGLSVGIDPRWWYGLRAAAALAALVAYRDRYTELHDPRARPRDWVLATILGALVFVVWLALDLPLFTLGTPAGFDPRADGAVDVGLAVTRVAGTVLVVPPMEELFWRSFVMRWLSDSRFLNIAPAHVGLRALLVSSVCFGAEHHLWLAGIIAGLVYGWLYVRTGNLWMSILAHAVTNGLLAAWVLRTGEWVLW